MKEMHEVDRILRQLLGKKIKPEEIQTLPIGHFYAVLGDKVQKVYVLPSGVPESAGAMVATGAASPDDIRLQYLSKSTAEPTPALPLLELLAARLNTLEKEVASLE